MPFHGQMYVDAIGAGMRRADVPALYLTQVTQPIGSLAKGVLKTGGVAHAVPGLRLGIDAVARIARWSSRREQADDTPSVRPTPGNLREVEPRPLSEWAVRKLLESAGIPVVPGQLARSAAEAERAVASYGQPAAMKIVSPGIAHKSDLGGVRLGVTAAEAALAYEEIIAACSRPEAGDARLEGVLVSPMRADAPELLVSVTRDRDWSLLLAVALGGVLVEVLDDMALTPLPVSPARARSMLQSLRGAAVLKGVRGRPAADFDQLASVVSAIGGLAEAIGPRLQTLEINPLRVAGSEIEALDALVVWRGGEL
jgi:acetate---CoA ligase (ADP-forming)